MLPQETSPTYADDLIEHYRAVNRRIRSAPFKAQPRKPPPRIVQVPLRVMPSEEPPEPDPWVAVLATALAELDPDQRAAALTPHPCERVIAETCAEHGITREELLSPKRTRATAAIRMLAMWKCRQAGVSLPKIGRHFGNRDHTTVLHAVRKIDAQMRGGEAS